MDKMEQKDLRYCVQYLNVKIDELYDEISQVEFNYAINGAFDILVAPEFKALKSFHITHFDDYMDYLTYLNKRLDYLFNLRSNVKKELDKKPEEFDPDLVDEDVYRIWSLVMEVME